jgi:CubicO group peptidase (beta-lactamase class C family)
MRFYWFPVLALVTSTPLRDGLPARVPIPADDVDDYVRREMSTQHIPGLSLAVVRNGKVVKSAGYGLASIELNVPVTRHTEFAIASMTKSITASAVMLLVQDGKLRLDDPVSRYIDSIPDSWKRITIRHLLTHTSGIKDHYGDYPAFSRVKLDRRLEYNEADYLKAHFVEPLNFEPGQYGAYSGSNFALLGLIITKVTGKPYAKFFQDRIFVPLGMSETHLLTGHDLIPNRATGYDTDEKGAITPQYTGVSFTEKADVSVVTTADDLAKWIVALTNGSLWTKESIDRMWTPGKLNDGRDVVGAAGASYGAGWQIAMANGFPMVGHGGTFNIGFASAMMIFPEQRMAVVVLDNDWSADPSRIGRGIAGFFDPDLKAPHLRNPDPGAHRDLTAAVQRVLPALFGAKPDITSLVTPGYGTHISAMPPASGPSPPPPPVSFIALDDISSRHLVRYGSAVTRMAHLKVMADGEHFVTLYLTADGRIADVSAY